MIEIYIFTAVVLVALAPVYWGLMTNIRLKRELLELQIREIKGPSAMEQMQEIVGDY